MTVFLRVLALLFGVIGLTVNNIRTVAEHPVGEGLMLMLMGMLFAILSLDRRV
jgi:hypothetical protein